MTPMTSALALARHRLVNERRDGPRWAEALREGAAMRTRAYAAGWRSGGFSPHMRVAYLRERQNGAPSRWVGAITTDEWNHGIPEGWIAQ